MDVNHVIENRGPDVIYPNFYTNLLKIFFSYIILGVFMSIGHYIFHTNLLKGKNKKNSNNQFQLHSFYMKIFIL